MASRPTSTRRSVRHRCHACGQALPKPKPPTIEWLGAVEQWERELAAGVGGQDRARPATWRIDGLYRAACLELSAREAWAEGLHLTAQRLLADAARALAADADHLEETAA